MARRLSETKTAVRIFKQQKIGKKNTKLKKKNHVSSLKCVSRHSFILPKNFLLLLVFIVCICVYECGHLFATEYMRKTVLGVGPHPHLV